MLMNIRINNCFVFDEETTFSMKAQRKDHHLLENVHKDVNALKSAGLFGVNSTGKTCLLKCIQVIKEMFLNKELSLQSNIYSKSDICELGIVFTHENNQYSYDIHYNVKTKAYVYERFVHSYKDTSDKEQEELWLLKDTINHEYRCLDKTLENILIAMSRDSLVVYLVDTDQFNTMKKIKGIIQAFASKIEVINIKDIPVQQTEELVQKHKDLKGEVIEFMLTTGLFSEDTKDMEVCLDHYVYRPNIYQRIATLAIY
ncbi:MAG: ATP-binding protein, partial [Erysipelotrichaceae bacterium]|nr:ATP-binding protein [Erysipelotrichaceae bacterium]